MKTRDTYMHEVPIENPMSEVELAEIRAGRGKDQVTLAILQMLRSKTALMEKAGRQFPADSHPGDYRAYHAGAADALEEFFWDIYQGGQTELDKELEASQ